MLSDFLKEVDGRLGVVVIVDAQNAKSGRFINSRKLIKALARSGPNEMTQKAARDLF